MTFDGVLCTKCLELGHNKRRCVAQPAQNRRAERARNWDRDISSSESNSELERELAPFVEQASARAKAKAKATARATVRATALPAPLASPVSSVLQIRPRRARKLPQRFR